MGLYEGMSEGKAEGSMVGAAVPSVGMLEGSSDDVSVGELDGKSVMTIVSVGETEGISDGISVIITPEGGDEGKDVGSSVVFSSEGEAEGAPVPTIAAVGLVVGADVSTADVGSSDGTSVSTG